MVMNARVTVETDRQRSKPLQMGEGWRHQYGVMLNPWAHSQMCEDMQVSMPTQISLLFHVRGSEATTQQNHTQCLDVDFQYYFLAKVTRGPGGDSTFYSWRGECKMILGHADV